MNIPDIGGSRNIAKSPTEKILQTIKPVYEQGLEAERIVDLAKTNELILDRLREERIPIVDSFARVRWHFSEPAKSVIEEKAIALVATLAGKGLLSPYIEKFGKQDIHYLYWESELYNFPFGAVINGRICCFLSENNHWLLDFQKKIICTVAQLPPQSYELESGVHLLFASR